MGNTGVDNEINKLINCKTKSLRMQGYLKRSTIMKFLIMVMVTVSNNNNNYNNNHSNINSV